MDGDHARSKNGLILVIIADVILDSLILLNRLLWRLLPISPPQWDLAVQSSGFKHS
jgi:hypothetical protein